MLKIISFFNSDNSVDSYHYQKRHEKMVIKMYKFLPLSMGFFVGPSSLIFKVNSDEMFDHINEFELLTE